jgi:hypothetical protein
MGIMNIVWPVAALYAGPLAVWAYVKIGRPSIKRSKPFWQNVLVGALHCGSGCTIGDLLAEIFLFFVPVTLAGSGVFGAWAIEYGFAIAIGLLFQYYAIKPMRHLSAGKTLAAAFKADILSLTFWQIGMYGWMAISFFVFFHRVLKASDPAFWLMMQLAMLVGLITAYPINWWLLRKGVKEPM